MNRLEGRLVLLLCGATLGCGFFAASPDQVARDFWDASVEGDFELAREYATASSRDMLDRADDAPNVEDVTLGEVEIDGDRANVQTSLVAMVNDRSMEIDFSTVLEKEDNEWRVNVSATTGQMISKIMGGAAGEIMSQIGEAVGQQMRGMMEGMMKGLAEGMEAMDSTFNAQR